MYGVRGVPELYRSSERLSTWLSKSTASVPNEVSRFEVDTVRRGSAAALLGSADHLQRVSGAGLSGTSDPLRRAVPALSPSGRSSPLTTDPGINMNKVNKRPGDNVPDQTSPRDVRQSITSIETSGTWDDNVLDTVRIQQAVTKATLKFHSAAIVLMFLAMIAALVVTTMQLRYFKDWENKPVASITVKSHGAAQTQSKVDVYRVQQLSTTHLIANITHNTGDETIRWFRPPREGFISGQLTLDGDVYVKVSERGFFLIYSQMIYTSNQMRKGDGDVDVVHSIYRRNESDKVRSATVLTQHQKTLRPGSNDVHTSYLSNLQYLENGDQVYVTLSHAHLLHAVRAHNNYLGIYKLVDVK